MQLNNKRHSIIRTLLIQRTGGLMITNFLLLLNAKFALEKVAKMNEAVFFAKIVKISIKS